MTTRIDPASAADTDQILALYRAVAAIEGGLARVVAEVTPEYVGLFVTRALASGVILVARDLANGGVAGEIHACALGPRVFAHVLGELTIAVHPKAQGRGIGRALFEQLLTVVTRDRPDVERVELVARASNQKAIAFYRSLGFREEGRLERRIRTPSGGREADIPMAWIRGRDG